MYKLIARIYSQARDWISPHLNNRFNDEALETLTTLPKHERLVALLHLGQRALRQKDFNLQCNVLQAIGELGTDESVSFIEDWLGSSSQEQTWAALVKGVATGSSGAEPLWKDRVFCALEAGLDDDSNTWRYRSWPWVSWPAAMIEIDPNRAVAVFRDRQMFRIEAPGFAAVIEAINQSSIALIPPEVTKTWLPAVMPSIGDLQTMENYLRQLQAHAEYDLTESKRRLWEMVEISSAYSMEAAAMLARIEGLPDPVWKLDSRIQNVGIENVRPAEKTVWIVANWFEFPLRTGGFDQYAQSYEANHVPQVIEALIEIGAAKTAAHLREWSRMFGSEWPTNQYVREELIAERGLQPANLWKSLNSEPTDDENVVLLNLRYQIAHYTDFERLETKAAA
jgi:hypothetical protein